MKRDKKPQRSEVAAAFQKAAPYLGIIYSFFGAILFLGYIGYLIDEKYEKSPLFILAGVFLGLILGSYRMIKVIQDLEKKTDK